LQIHPWVHMSSQTTDGVNRKKGIEVVRGRKERVRGHSEMSQNMLNYSREGILS